MTPRQKGIYDYITRSWAEKGYGPTYRDIAKQFNLRSISNVHRILHTMKANGHLIIPPDASRAVRPAGKCPCCGAPNG